MTGYWVKNVHPKKCALHKHIGKKCGEPISTKTLQGIVETPVGNKFRGRTVTPLLKRRANFALVARSFKHPKRR